MKKHGFVYFITSQDSGLTKVGFSYDPAKRLKQLQTAHASKLNLEMQIKTKNPRALEARLHSFFNHKRQVGEWFRLNKEDVQLITKEFTEANLGETIAQAIRDCFISGNVCDSNLEPANIVDAISKVATALDGIRHQNEIISKRNYESAQLIAGTLSKFDNHEPFKPLQPEALPAADIISPLWPLDRLRQEFHELWTHYLKVCGITKHSCLIDADWQIIEPFPTSADGDANVLLLYPFKAKKEFNFAISCQDRLFKYGWGASSRKWFIHLKLDAPRPWSEPAIKKPLTVGDSTSAADDHKVALEVLARLQEKCRSGGASA